MAQELKCKVSKNSGESTKLARERPPARLRHITIVFSWELYMKHKVRAAAAEGNLRFIMPIGKSVGNALSKKRLEDPIAVPGGRAIVEINPPAPNAMVKISYDRYYHRIVATIDGHLD